MNSTRKVFLKHSRQRKRNRKKKNKRVYTKKNYQSGDGMLTAVWGPGLWHYMHTMSFNYPMKPTNRDKKYYREFIINLQHVLPCKHCRDNLKNNLISHPLKDEHMKDRMSYSKYVYTLHEVVNKMLGKNSGLSYCDVRERYEHFRSRCTEEKASRKNDKRKTRKEKGCTEPLYGKKSKCVIKIIPHTKKCKTIQIDKKCVKKR
uniref:thiol oxidase n=1 Tax=viral metagenome TaxID=1070528 RepID=A0A6C0BXB7_9ZZZZ